MNFAGRRVLVVEDEYFIAQDVVDALQNAGATVLGPYAGEADALRTIEGNAPDLAVLDINLRGQVNFALAERLRQLRIPFVFATGYETSSIPAALKDVPIWTKPFETDALVTALGELRNGDEHRPS